MEPALHETVSSLPESAEIENVPSLWPPFSSELESIPRPAQRIPPVTSQSVKSVLEALAGFKDSYLDYLGRNADLVMTRVENLSEIADTQVKAYQDLNQRVTKYNKKEAEQVQKLEQLVCNI